MNDDWNNVTTQQDIVTLLDEYGDFHDACLKELRYTSGAYVDQESKTMHFGMSGDAVLYVIFHRQWGPVTIELKFSGLRRMNIIGHPDNYLCNLDDCHLSFYKKYILWADHYGFDESCLGGNEVIKEPMCTYIIADKLEWKILP